MQGLRGWRVAAVFGGMVAATRGSGGATRGDASVGGLQGGGGGEVAAKEVRNGGVAMAKRGDYRRLY